MEPREKVRYEMLAEIFRALGNPTRVFIIEHLATHREKCVCELTSLIGTDVSTVSRHLSALKKAGVVEDERRGAMTFYRLRTPCVLTFFKCAEQVLRENLQARAEILK